MCPGRGIAASRPRQTARRCSSSTTPTPMPRSHRATEWSTSTGSASTNPASSRLPGRPAAPSRCHRDAGDDVRHKPRSRQHRKHPQSAGRHTMINSRRDFMKATGAAAASLVMPNARLGGRISPEEASHRHPQLRRRLQEVVDQDSGDLREAQAVRLHQRGCLGPHEGIPTTGLSHRASG